MRNILIISALCIATAFGQNMDMLSAYKPVADSAFYVSTYSTTIVPTSNTAILLTAGSTPALLKVQVQFKTASVSTTSIDVRRYRDMKWTNGVALTTTPVWQPTYTAAGVQVSGKPDMVNLNPANVYKTTIGSFLTSGNTAITFQGLSNIGAVSTIRYASAETPRLLLDLIPSLYILPNTQEILVMSNSSGAGSNAVMQIIVTAYVPRGK